MITVVDCQVLKSSLKTIISEADKIGPEAEKIKQEAEAMERWIDYAVDNRRK